MLVWISIPSFFTFILFITGWACSPNLFEIKPEDTGHLCFPIKDSNSEEILSKSINSSSDLKISDSFLIISLINSSSFLNASFLFWISLLILFCLLFKSEIIFFWLPFKFCNFLLSDNSLFNKILLFSFTLIKFSSSITKLFLTSLISSIWFFL